MQKEHPKVGIGVIVYKDNKVLIGKRKGSHGAGHFAFPGGHLEFGETPAACACRELLEETGLIAIAITPGPWTNDVFDGHKHYVTLFMFVTEFSGTPQVMEPDKCESWDWYSWEELPQPLFTCIETLIENVGLEHLKNQQLIKADMS